MKYAFIKSNLSSYEVTKLCRILQVSTSGYYDWVKRPMSRRASYDLELLLKIKHIHEASKQAYGYVKTWRTLRAQGISCGKHKVARLRRQHHIEAKRTRRFKITTQSKNSSWVAPNRLNRAFAVSKPNRVWVGDVTCIRTRQGWLYLAVLLDLYSRKVIGWSMSNNNNKDLVLNALDMALLSRKPQHQALHHTDRGSVYACDEYRGRLSDNQLIPSMSRKGDCYDNAVAESFFSTLKNELVLGTRFESRDHAKSEVFKYIEVFYNRQRLHQSLNYRTTEKMEMLLN